MNCPKCGNKMRNRERYYECSECKLKFWKRIFGKNMSDDEIETLLQGNELPYIEGFRKQDGGTFGARLKLDENYKVVPYWEPGDGQDPSLKCPKCGKPIRKTSKAWGCSGWQEGCDFVIWNVIAGHILTDEEKKTLINGEKTDLISDFISKKGYMFPGKLVLDEDKKVVFVKKEDM